MSTLTIRPHAQAIARTRASITFFTHLRKTQPDDFRMRFRLCVLHAALNILMGKPNSHKLTLRKSSHGYAPDSVDKAVNLYVEDAKAGVFDGPLRLYILVFPTPEWKGKPLKGLGSAAAQVAHAVAELAHAYGQHPQYLDWLKTDKTVVVLDADTAPPAQRHNLTSRNYRAYPVDVSRSPVCGFYDGYLERAAAYAFLPMTQAQADGERFSSLGLLGA